MSHIRNRLLRKIRREPTNTVTLSNTNPRATVMSRINAVYYPNWRVYRQQSPSSLNLDFVTHIFYAFAWLKPGGTIYSSDEDADTKVEINGVHGALADLKRVKSQRPHIKTLLSLGGGGKGSDNFPAVASTPQSVARLTATAKGFLDTYQIDGIDIDWEHPSNPVQGQHYINLLAALRQALPSPQYLLTSALPCGEFALANINLAHATQILDYINLMCYDFFGPWTKLSGHQSQLYSATPPDTDSAEVSCDWAIGYLLSHGVPANKVLLGIPTYGRSFLGAKKVGDTYKCGAGEEGTFEYCDLPRPGAKVHYDTKYGATYCVGGDGGFVSFDDPQSVQEKAEFVKAKALGGLFYWTGTGDTNDERSLVAAGWHALK